MENPRKSGRIPHLRFPYAINAAGVFGGHAGDQATGKAGMGAHFCGAGMACISHAFRIGMSEKLPVSYEICLE